MTKVTDSPSWLFPLLFLSSPSRPIGSFAFSGGMESFAAHGLVRDRESLLSYLTELARYGYARTELPLLARCFRACLARDPKALARWDRLSLALRESEEFLLEERELGASTMRLARSHGLLPGFLEEDGPQPLGYVAATAALACGLGLGEGDLGPLLSAFLWALIEGQVTAASKSVPLGQAASQAALLGLSEGLPALVGESLSVQDDGIGTSLPMRAILSARHETSPARMFRS
ncbi:MAG: urease accessory protein UreF [Deltaproteobacteria bacterium]|nr:urease accessory protein UreF [Deltaproteobacteria bacterium]